MKKQLYARGSTGYVKKIQEFQDHNQTTLKGPLGNFPQIKLRGRWYVFPSDAEIIEFDPDTLTMTRLYP